MTLLETLIAMSLLSVLLVIVFGLFRELSFIQDLDKKDAKKTFYDTYLKMRLYEVFSNLPSETDNIGNGLFAFFSERIENISSSPSLVFTFNNGIRSDPYNSSYILGRLYIENEKGELRLATWPLNLKNPHAHMRQEVLLPNVEEMRFNFLSSPKDNSRLGDYKPPLEIERRGEWQDNWEQNYKEMPILLQVHLKLKDDPIEKNYFFVLPVHRYIVKFQR